LQSKFRRVIRKQYSLITSAEDEFRQTLVKLTHDLIQESIASRDSLGRERVTGLYSTVMQLAYPRYEWDYPDAVFFEKDTQEKYQEAYRRKAPQIDSMTSRELLELISKVRSHPLLLEALNSISPQITIVTKDKVHPKYTAQPPEENS
jgi:hypothetical protein